MKHKSIKRVFNRIYEEISATFDIYKRTSFSEAINTFIAKIDIQIMNHNGYKETPKIKKRLEKKHETMMKYIDLEYKEFIKKYNFNDVKLIEKNIKYDNKIWICWWQGIENAPEIVKKCINTIKENSKNHEIIIIDKYNYKKFVEFPKWLEEKKDKKIISLTHYSDLIRMHILAKYGGIWLDSTFYCIGDIDEYFNYPLWSIKRPDYFHASIASGYFANYSLGCDYNNRRIFKIIEDFLIEYWKKNNKIIDYLLTDYIISLVQNYDEQTKIAFRNIKNNNKNCDELFKVLNEEYSEIKWEKIKQNTKLFKLTWKSKFKEYNNNKITFYGKIINEELK